MIESNIDTSTNVLSIRVLDGARELGKLTIHPSDVKTRAWADYAMMHGLKQRLVDVMALGQFHKVGDRKGEKVTEADKWEVCSALWTMMHDENVWSNRAPAGEGSNDTGLLLEALVRGTGAPEADCKALMATWDKSFQAAMRDRDPTIAPIVAAIRAERAAKRPAVDTGAALKALMQRPIGGEDGGDPEEAPF